VKCITIKQPWAWLIAAGLKDIENRTWRTAYRGRLLIHSAMVPDDVDLPEIEARHGITIDRGALHNGVTVATVKLHNIVTHHPSPWFVGPLGWVLRDAQPVEPIPMKGRLSIYDPPAHVRGAILPRRK